MEYVYCGLLPIESRKCVDSLKTANMFNFFGKKCKCAKCGKIFKDEIEQNKVVPPVPSLALTEFMYLIKGLALGLLYY